jgi:hypothetical protein
LPHAFRGVADEVVVGEGQHWHPLPQHADGLLTVSERVKPHAASRRTSRSAEGVTARPRAVIGPAGRSCGQSEDVDGGIRAHGGTATHCSAG